MQVTSTLELRTVHGTQVYGILGTPWNLVKLEADGSYAPVSAIDRDVSAAEMDSDYGVWVDKQVTTGVMRWKKVDRAEDGQVQSDEVMTFPAFRRQQFSHVCRVGEDLGYSFETAEIRDGQLVATWSETRGEWGRFDYLSPLFKPPDPRT